MDSKLKKLMMTSLFLVILLAAILLFGRYGDSIKTLLEGDKVTAEPTNPPDSYYSEIRNGQLGDDLKGFLKNPDFFDTDTSNPLAEAVKEAKTFDVSWYSLENDLRLQIFDYTGKRVEDIAFEATIEGVGSSSDLDCDGVIIIHDIPAGEYDVDFGLPEGYYLSENPVHVLVKDKAVLEIIPDISLFIEDEENVDIILEDVFPAEAVSDFDKTEVKKIIQKANAETGVKVSSADGDIDWKAVSEAGISFAIIRAGYRGRSTETLIKDAKYEENLRAAKLAGLSVGVYFQSGALSEKDVIEEASAVVDILNGSLLTLPVFFDIESYGVAADGYEISNEEKAHITDSFIKLIKKTEYVPAMMGSKSFLENEIKPEQVDDCFVLLKEYREAPTYSGFYDCWQYTDKGKVNGIDGNVSICLLYTY